MKTKYKHDIISIGDPVVDSFLFIHDIEIKKIKGQAKAIINWADKLPVDQFYKSVAGNATNNAVGSARLGLKAAYYCVIAHDVGGREILHKMRKEGVDTQYIQIDDKHGTNYHTVLCYGGERTIFVFHEHRPYKLPKLAPSKWLYLTSMPKGFQKIYSGLSKYIDEHDVNLAFNPGTFMLRAGLAVNRSMLKRTALLSLNIEEAQSWTGTPSRDPEVLCKKLAGLGPKAVVLTDGRSGAYSYSSEGFFFLPVYPGPHIEATGAGDAFTTAYVAALAYGKGHKEALRWGPVNAGSVVQHVGPLTGLLTKRQLEQHLAKLKRFVPIEITDAESKKHAAKLAASGAKH
jgi:sugar/nucleoside kinase (ribokinase family)